MNSKLKRVTKTALSLGPKCNYIMLRLTQKEKLACPKLYTKAPDWRGGTSLGCLTNELSKSFPAKNDGRGNEMPMWPAQSRKLELQNNGPRSFDCRTVSFGQATVKTLKDMLLNVIVIENCSTSVMKSPGLWGNMALVSSL